MAGNSMKTVAKLLCIACIIGVQFDLLDAVAVCPLTATNTGTCPNTLMIVCTKYKTGGGPTNTCACDTDCQTGYKCCPFCGALTCTNPRLG
jgi:hypothetical protein